MPRARQSKSDNYDLSVFINCPFDRAYRPLFRAIAFSVIHCGFRARCALEIEDGSQVRIEKIFRIIEECRLGVHDLSRTELDRATKLPRFNMPLELGMFLAAKRFGDTHQRRKACLILDREPHRYQSFISDIAGHDIQSHSRIEGLAISKTSDWLRNASGRVMPGGSYITKQYALFKRNLPRLCSKLNLRTSEMTFNDFANIVTSWLTVRPSPT